MATFTTAYEKYIKPWEGGYVNNPADKGGETYAGIARNFNPTWSGWSYIDEVKQKSGSIKTNTKFPAIQDKVDNFYLLAMWEPNKFGQIKNQDVANILFDWYVNSGSNAANTKGVETYGVDEILNRDFGFKLPLDSKFDSATINAINAVDPVKLHNIIKRERENFYRVIVKNNPSQKVFEKGWLARIASFPELKTVALISGGMILLLIIFVLVLIKQ